MSRLAPGVLGGRPKVQLAVKLVGVRVYVIIVEPSALAPGVIRKLVQASAGWTASAASAAQTVRALVL